MDQQPSKLDTVCTVLPRLPSQTELIPLKLKRKLAYRGHYMYNYVSPEKVLNALTWLKALYSDVEINYDWLEQAKTNDEELIVEQCDESEQCNTDNEPTDTNNEPEQFDADNVLPSCNSAMLVSQYPLTLPLLSNHSVMRTCSAVHMSHHQILHSLLRLKH